MSFRLRSAAASSHTNCSDQHGRRWSSASPTSGTGIIPNSAATSQRGSSRRCSPARSRRSSHCSADFPMAPPDLRSGPVLDRWRDEAGAAAAASAFPPWPFPCDHCSEHVCRGLLAGEETSMALWVAGQLTNADGEPLPRLNVVALADPGAEPLGHGTSDEDGAFAVELDLAPAEPPERLRFEVLSGALEMLHRTPVVEIGFEPPDRIADVVLRVPLGTSPADSPRGRSTDAEVAA